MPVEHNDMKRIRNNRAFTAWAESIGSNTLASAKPACPVATGNLRDSHEYAVNRTEKAVDVGVTAEYGAAVHDGTKHMAGRPWLRDTVERNGDALLRRAAEVYAATLGGGR